MSALAERVDVQRIMRQRELALSVYGNGVEYDFTMRLLQRGEYLRTNNCPHCGRNLRFGEVVDMGAQGIRCSECAE